MRRFLDAAVNVKVTKEKTSVSAVGLKLRLKSADVKHDAWSDLKLLYLPRRCSVYVSYYVYVT